MTWCESREDVTLPSKKASRLLLGGVASVDLLSLRGGPSVCKVSYSEQDGRGGLPT